MNLRYSAKFRQALRALSRHDKIAVIHALELFEESPSAPSLRNHALDRDMRGKRAIVADHDLRIIFTERGNYKDVTLLDVGGHADVYRH